MLETDEYVLWKPNIREENQELAARGVRFMRWLSTRKENEIAVVTHSGFLHETLKLFGNDCGLAVENEISEHFANCEIRSVVLVDKCYPGKIPAGEDLADEK